MYVNNVIHTLLRHLSYNRCYSLTCLNKCYLFIHYVHTVFMHTVQSAETFFIIASKNICQTLVNKIPPSSKLCQIQDACQSFWMLFLQLMLRTGEGGQYQPEATFWCIRAWQYTIFYYNETGYRSVSDTPKNSPLLCAFRRGGGRGEGVYAYVVRWSDL